MNFIEQDSRNRRPSAATDETRDANYFAFFDRPTPENLSANRGGFLTPQQKKALEAIVSYQRSLAVGAGGVSLFCVTFMCFLFWRSDAADGVVSVPAQLIFGAVLILIFGIFSNFLIGDRIFFFAGDDLANGVVESAKGEIAWNGKRYRMRTGDRLHPSLRNGAALPPPGAYRFYYLPITGIVVMAEELATGQADDPVSVLRQVLASTNNFSADDLRQNQKGLLSKRQENRLLGILAFDGLIFLIGLVLFVSMIPQILRAVSTGYFFLLLIIGVIVVLRFGWAAVRMIQDLWRGQVKQIDGPVSRQTRRSRYRTTYLYVIDTHKFEVTSAAYHALLEQPTYRIYYVPNSKRLVSIEPIHPASQTHS